MRENANEACTACETDIFRIVKIPKWKTEKDQAKIVEKSTLLPPTLYFVDSRGYETSWISIGKILEKT